MKQRVYILSGKIEYKQDSVLIENKDDPVVEILPVRATLGALEDILADSLEDRDIKVLTLIVTATEDFS